MLGRIRRLSRGVPMKASELSARYVETLNARDYDTFRGLLADEIHFYQALNGVLITKPDDVVDLYRQVMGAQPDLRLDVTNIVSTEEWAAMEMNVVLNDRIEQLSVFHRWEHDKLVYYHNYIDPSSQPKAAPESGISGLAQGATVPGASKGTR